MSTCTFILWNVFLFPCSTIYSELLWFRQFVTHRNNIWIVDAFHLLVLFFPVDEENDADEEEGHIINETDKEINKDKERIEDEPLCDEQGSPDQTNGEISISLLRAKNLSLLQSQ